MSSALPPVGQSQNTQSAANAAPVIIHKIVPTVPPLVLETNATFESAAVVEELSEKMTAVVGKYASFSISPAPSSEVESDTPYAQTVRGGIADLTSLYREYPNLESLTLIDCPHLESLCLKEKMPRLHTLTLVNLSRFESTGLSEIIEGPGFGKLPSLTRLTIKNCPLINDRSCSDISEMINNGLTHLVLEDLSCITSAGLGRLGRGIQPIVGSYAIKSILMLDPRIQWADYPREEGSLGAYDDVFCANYLRLKEIVASNVARQPLWK
jgi:hypothetical protein